MPLDSAFIPAKFANLVILSQKLEIFKITGVINLNTALFMQLSRAQKLWSTPSVARRALPLVK